MPEAKDKPHYELDLPGKLGKKVSSIKLDLSLDDSAKLTVTLGMKAAEAMKLTPRELPQEASFQWQGRNLFKGQLSGVSMSDAFRTTLTFHDPLNKARKNNENVFFKQQSLQDCIDKLAAKAGLSARCVGNFGEQIPSLDLAGASLFEHLVELANEFGFYFFAKPGSDQITCLKVGNMVKEVKLSHNSHVSKVEHRLNTASYVSTAKVRYFDPETLEPRDKQMTASDVYGSLASFRDHATYREKTSWPQAKGSFDGQVAQGFHFDSAEQLVRNQLSKRLMEQETVRMRVLEPVGVPGDRLTLSDSFFGSHQDGAFLIKSCSISVDSAMPVMDLEAIRP